MTPRSKIYNDKDKRNSLISFMIWHKYFDLNVEKMKESFEDNPLMKINIWLYRMISKLMCLQDKKELRGENE